MTRKTCTSSLLCVRIPITAAKSRSTCCTGSNSTSVETHPELHEFGQAENIDCTDGRLRERGRARIPAGFPSVDWTGGRAVTSGHWSLGAGGRPWHTPSPTHCESAGSRPAGPSHSSSPPPEGTCTTEARGVQCLTADSLGARWRPAACVQSEQITSEEPRHPRRRRAGRRNGSPSGRMVRGVSLRIYPKCSLLDIRAHQIRHGPPLLMVERTGRAASLCCNANCYARVVCD